MIIPIELITLLIFIARVIKAARLIFIVIIIFVGGSCAAEFANVATKYCAVDME